VNYYNLLTVNGVTVLAKNNT